jgi:lipopolysaccharide heptosyltransferase I
VTRFLVVRLGALGDVVHAIPVAAALRRAFPSAQIDWLVSAKHREILDFVSCVDHRIAVNDRGGAGSGAGASLGGALRVMRRAHYDVAIDLQGLIKSAVIARLSGARRVVGFNARYARERLARVFYTDVHDPGGDGMFAPSETRHVVTINLGVLAVLGVAPGPPEFPLAVSDSVVARAMRESAGGRYALLNPGAAWPNKRWPPARFGALAARLRDRQGLRSVVLWGPGEVDLGEGVVAASEGAALLSPKTSVADLVALAQGAHVMVSGDTGPTHIAAAVGTPLVGIYGPTRPERNGPWLPDDETVSRASICQCHHLRQCRAATMCLRDIGVEEVLAAVERRVGKAEAARG